MKDKLTILKAFSDEKRLTILEQLKKGELCACNLLDNMDISQSGLSYQMKILVDSGLVTSQPNGKWVHYQINKEGVEQAIDIIKDLTGI